MYLYTLIESLCHMKTIFQSFIFFTTDKAKLCPYSDRLWQGDCWTAQGVLDKLYEKKEGQELDEGTAHHQVLGQEGDCKHVLLKDK